MQTEKKLNLGPLPEQTEDYSRYEETKVRWDRIIAVMAIPLILLLIVLGFVVGGDDNSVLEKDVERSAGSVLETSTVPSVSVEANSNNELEEPSGSTALVSVPASPQITETKAVEKFVPDTSEIEPESSANDNLAPLVDKELINQSAPKELASVLIVNSAIESATLSLTIKDGKPGDSLSSVVPMSDAGIFKIILHTEMVGIRGTALFHEWYRNDVRQARVKIPVNVNRQSSYSSKYINHQMTGNWRVKVVDDMGEPYVLADFEVTK